MQIIGFFVQLQDKINPNEQTDKETEKVACQINSIDPSYFEVQQRTVSHQENYFVLPQTDVRFQGSYHDFLLSCFVLSITDFTFSPPPL